LSNDQYVTPYISGLRAVAASTWYQKKKRY
jgi:hypothetical protein